MNNKPPVSICKVSATELTLPLNEISWDLTGSYDLNKDNQPVDRNFKFSVVLDGKQVSTEPVGTLALEVGNHRLEGTVTDKRGASSTDVVDIIIHPAKAPCIFGGKVTDLPIEDQITVLKACGATTIRLAVELSTWNGGRVKAIDQAEAAGLKVILNINWEPAGSTRKFPTDMPKYREVLGRFLDVHKPEVGVCENEPTADKFYDDSIDDYIIELTNFAEVCKEKGVQCTDGCVFVEWINTIIDGGKLRENGVDNKTLLQALITIPTTFVNAHFVVKGTYIPDLRKFADYVRNLTGKEVMSNEHHYELSDPATVAKTQQALRDAGFKYATTWFGGVKGGDRLNIGTSLTDEGLAYKEAIAA